MNIPETLILEDIITPVTIKIWPLALGWWLLFMVVIVTMVILVLFIRRYTKKWGYRRLALTLLDDEYRQWQLSNDDQQCLKGMSAVVKRTAMTAYPAAEVKALYGNQWVDFLNQHSKKIRFHPDLFIHTYQKNSHIKIDDLYQRYKTWINTHQMPIPKR